MKTRIVAIAIIGLLVLSAFALTACGSKTPSTTPGSSGGTSGGASVAMQNFAFSPATVEIKVGESVTWTNNDSVSHTVDGDGGIASGDMAGGATYTKKFDTAGTFAYKCSIHPSMTGKVVVK